MKVLLVKLNHIGDTLILTPTIHAIRQQYPDAVIDVVVRRGCESVLENNPDISRTIALAKPEKSQRRLGESVREFRNLLKQVGLKRYDYAFDLSNSDRAKLILLLSGAKRRGINIWHTDLKWKKMLFTDFADFAWGRVHQVYKDYKTVQQIMGLEGEPGPLRLETSHVSPDLLTRFRLEGTPYVVIHPTSRWTFKEWLIPRWRKVTAYFGDKGYRVLLSCGPDSREIDTVRQIADGFPHVTMTRGKTSLTQLGFLIRHAHLFLGVDTVAMHIAAAVQTPVVALFGPSAEWSWSPWKVPHHLVLGACPCKESRRFTCDKSKIFPCMERIETSAVLAGAQQLLNRRDEAQ